MKYDIAFDENNNPTFSYYRERIVKNNKTFFWVDPVHEVIAIHGKRIYFDAAISHKKIRTNASDRNLKIYQKLIDGGAKLSARQKFYYSRELMYNQLYEQAITSFIEYLEQYNGWVENKIEACLNLASCYVNINQKHKALQSLFGSFVFDIPRAQVLCEIGHILCANKKYEQAIFWYELATKCKPNYESGAFIQKEYYDLIPYLQLCVCHYNLNNIEKAIYYNNKAHKIKPNDKAVLQNKQFFNQLKKQKSAQN
jgi:tetratricopeptide (TPR) repeat protein